MPPLQASTTADAILAVTPGTTAPGAAPTRLEGRDIWNLVRAVKIRANRHERILDATRITVCLGGSFTLSALALGFMASEHGRTVGLLPAIPPVALLAAIIATTLLEQAAYQLAKAIIDLERACSANPSLCAAVRAGHVVRSSVPEYLLATPRMLSRCKAFEGTSLTHIASAITTLATEHPATT